MISHPRKNSENGIADTLAIEDQERRREISGEIFRKASPSVAVTCMAPDEDNEIDHVDRKSVV